MFGTRRLEKFDLHAFRRSPSVPAEDSHRATVDEDGVVTESGELPVVPRAAAPEIGAMDDDTLRVAPQAALLEVPTPLVDFNPSAWAAEEAPTRRSQDVSPAPVRSADALRTRLTKKFVSLAELVNEAFADTLLGEGEYSVELTAPKDMSTNGGKLAMELLRLKPRREGFAVVLAGTLSATRAELREYEYVAAWHSGRFQRPLPFSAETWEAFLEKVEALLRDAGVESVRVPLSREVGHEEGRSMARVSKPATVALVVSLGLAAIACLRVAMLMFQR